MSVAGDKIDELNRLFLEFMSKSENVELATKEIYEDLLDEVLIGFVFDVHRVTKTGSSDVEEGIPDNESYAIVDSPGLDVFGQHPIKKSQECSCPNCERGVAASRFATHLEKCMGMGRNSSRIASRRIANNSKDLTTYTGAISDDDDDVDWSMNNDKRKRRKDRNGLRKLKQPKIGILGQQQQLGALGTASGSGNQKNGSDSASGGQPEFGQTSSESSSPSNYENMTLEEKRVLLQQICGVVSGHTKKLCTRSMRCPQHSDEQRREMRASLEASVVQQDGVHIDIDTYEESDGQNLRESLARWERDREGSSPADSASTTSTSSSLVGRKRESKSKGKNKASKRDRVSPSSQAD
ncbi:ataxin-7-like protein 3 [Copidosoma floridanum]|uniref:ataxin-7-like protein 3 n=1 Tax=Copidosoma floridanum TaxID=29053 RepID=UPI0006C9B169|nr:ataxin-7-like protein 3 [Copidosoma floridanum]